MADVVDMGRLKARIGDVMCLKSGGPRLTVAEDEGDDGVVTCVWFIDGGQSVNSRFHWRMLKKMEG